jgi:hypothetical protein
MKMKITVIAAAIAAAGFAAGAARAADYVTIELKAPVNAPADAAWTKVKDFCAIGGWMKTTCTVAGGPGVGEVRTIAGRVNEVLVSETARSYTYSQPKSPIDYHGTVEIRPDGAKTSTLIYTLVYDADALPKGADGAPADKAKDKAGRTAMFTRVLGVIKDQAEK